MLDLFRTLFGTYSPIQSLVSGDPVEGTAVYSYSCDWSYIFNCIVFAIVLYCFFRLVGILLGGSNK